ncbi:hypothetical protein [Thalassotalea litorea]|uniref:hypothetical protein n=1 Tax=Thalassotalea litorea TaxID=2020715 RepID=UPI003735A086
MAQEDKASQALAEIAQLKKQLAELERSKSEDVSPGDEPSSAAGASTTDVIEQAQTESPKTQESLNEQEQLEQLMEELKQELSDHQGASILGAFALGFLLGRLIR